jgi:hypothetical protein
MFARLALSLRSVRIQKPPNAALKASKSLELHSETPPRIGRPPASRDASDEHSNERIRPIILFSVALDTSQ